MSEGAAAPLVSARVVIVVARDRPALYEYLRKAFVAVGDVEVILDQRIPDPGKQMLQVPAALSSWQPDVYDELTLRGFIIKRLE